MSAASISAARINRKKWACCRGASATASTSPSFSLVGNLLLLERPNRRPRPPIVPGLWRHCSATSQGGVSPIGAWFLDRIATHILAFEGNSEVVFFQGNYADYAEDLRRRKGDDADQPHRIRYKKIG